MENILEMKCISKSFHGVRVLKDVDFSVKKGEVHALCGENGAGKSTLMKILAGVHKRDNGTIVFKGRELGNISTLEAQPLGISMIYQELNLLNDLTVAQNIFLRREKTGSFGLINEKEMIRQAGKLLEELEDIDPAVKVKNLGIAQKQIVEVAKALSFNADLIIMDEPTAVLTSKETEILFNLIRRLKEKGVSVVYISHRLPEIRTICDRVTVLRDGNLVDTRPISEVTEKDIAKMMVGREIEEIYVKDTCSANSEEILKVENLNYRDILKNISFSLKNGEILGISGLIGAGRTELAEVLFGLRKPYTGNIYFKGKKISINSPSEALRHKIGFATEDRKYNGLLLERSVKENINLVKHLKAKGFFISKKNEKNDVDEITELFKIKYSSMDNEVINLSGGNQQKIVLGKWVNSDTELFILDEPTRGVDVGARKEIYTLINNLAESGKSIVVISSDITEILSICQRIIIMFQGRIVGELNCSEATEEKIMIHATGIMKGV